ncbi:MAG: MarR family transcriptional regulator [Cyclobacteriaceae bacterium]|nr:MarR family transcriptional regulator [Cyclobacteriaceae bacterium]
MKIEEEIKQSKFIDPFQKAGINLIYTTNWLLGKQQAFFKPFGITPQQFNILRILKGQHPKSISATEVKSRMLDRNSDVSRMVDRLVAKKLISKSVCPSDKRASDILITQDGLELLKTIDKHQNQLDHFLDLTENEAILISDLLDKSRG